MHLEMNWMNFICMKKEICMKNGERHTLKVYIRKFMILWFRENKIERLKIKTWMKLNGYLIWSGWMNDWKRISFWWIDGMIIYDELSMLQSSLNRVCVLVLYRMLIVLFILSSGKRFTATPTSASSSQIFFKRTFGFICSGTTNFVWSVFRLEFKEENKL